MKFHLYPVLLVALTVGTGCDSKTGPVRVPVPAPVRVPVAAPVTAPAPAPAERHATLPMVDVVKDAPIYDLPAALVDHHGKSVDLAVWKGQPTLIAMFYASCPQACPLLIGNIQYVESLLTPAERAELRVLLVSFEPEADTPEVLRGVLTRHGLDGQRWRLTRADEPVIRDVAAVLGIAYRPIDGGDFNHASAIALLDRTGHIVARQDGIVRAAQPLKDAITAQVAAKAKP